MKKLMIVAAVAMAAFASQAAQVAWQMTATKADAAAGNGLNVYMILADNWQLTWQKADDIIAAAVPGQVKAFSVGSKAANTPVSTYQSADLSVGDKLSYYLVMLDAANSRYYASDLILSSSATADGKNDYDGQSLLPAVSPTTDKWAVESGLKTDGNWTKFSSVPEPTSGLLLLLGMAGLALRRRRA